MEVNFLIEKEIQKCSDNTEMKMKISWEIHAIDYQMKENEKYYKLEQQDVIGAIVKRERLDINSVFVFEDWMIPIIEKNVVENFFHFERALRLIKTELKIHNFKNFDLLTEYDLRTKWTELELNKFRPREEKFFYDESLPIKNSPIENKKEEKREEPAKISENKNVPAPQKPIQTQKAEIREEIINTSGPKDSSKQRDNSIYDDIGNDDIISLPKTAHQTTTTQNTRSGNTKQFDELD